MQELIVREFKGLFVVTQLERGRSEPNSSHNGYFYHIISARPYDGELKDKLGISSLRSI